MTRIVQDLGRVYNKYNTARYYSTLIRTNVSYVSVIWIDQQICLSINRDCDRKCHNKWRKNNLPSQCVLRTLLRLLKPSFRGAPVSPSPAFLRPHSTYVREYMCAARVVVVSIEEFSSIR